VVYNYISRNHKIQPITLRPYKQTRT